MSSALGIPKKRRWTTIRGGRDTARAPVLCQNNIEGRRAVCWGGPQGILKKRPWTTIQLAEIPAWACACCQINIEGRQAAHWRGPLRSRKSGIGPLLWGLRTRASPAISGLTKSELTKNRFSWV